MDELKKRFDYGLEVLENNKPLRDIIIKACEELAELQVVLLQIANKPQMLHALKDNVSEEIVDCHMNFELLKKFFKVDEKLIEQKVNEFLTSNDYLHYLTKQKEKDDEIIEKLIEQKK